MNYPDGSSFFGEWKDGERGGMGIYTYPFGIRLKGLFAGQEFIKSVDFDEALLE